MEKYSADAGTVGGSDYVHDFHTPPMADNRDIGGVPGLLGRVHGPNCAFIIDPHDQYPLSRSRLESSGRSRLRGRFVSASVAVNDAFLGQRSEPLLNSL